jgi:hypothetical protein
MAIVARVVVYIVSERILGRNFEVPAIAMSHPTDPASIAEGRRLAIGNPGHFRAKPNQASRPAVPGFASVHFSRVSGKPMP